MYSEEGLLQLSALQHIAFCERQWALIHLEQVWVENRLTLKGRQLHEKSDTPETEVRGDVRIARGLLIHSFRLGLSGKADVVEFHKVSPESKGSKLNGARGLWMPFPVEFKHGAPKRNNCDKVQLCAQALCLEEMLNVRIPAGALFYGKTKRRLDVEFDEKLRRETETLAKKLHELTRLRITPSARYSKRCDKCSLLQLCMPKVAGEGKSARRYMLKAFE